MTSHRLQPVMAASSLPRFRLRTFILAGSAVLLAWLVISRSLTVYLADVAPQAALWLNPWQPEALVNLADRSLNRAVAPRPIANAAGPPPASSTGGSAASPQGLIPGTGQNNAAAPTRGPAPDSESLDHAFDVFQSNSSVDLPRVRAWAVSALMNDPLNARALRILGQVSTATGNDADAIKFMTTAARLSLHDSIAVYWMMHRSAEANNYQAAISYANALMRTNPEFAQYVMPLLGHYAEQKASSGLIKAALESDPPWRDIFFSYLTDEISDARTPLNLFVALRASSSPPTAKEVDNYLAILIAHKFYNLAYFTWLQFLPPEELRTAGFLFNGNFAIVPGGSPFDWAITQGSGVTVDIVPTPDTSDGHALSVNFLYGRVEYQSVSELVALAPGTYQFEGQYKGKLVGPRGLKWRAICADEAQTRIGESPMISDSGNSSWKQVDFTFTVPSAGCPAQYIRLDLDARMPSEKLVTGSMLFNELHIARVSSPAVATQSSH